MPDLGNFGANPFVAACINKMIDPVFVAACKNKMIERLPTPGVKTDPEDTEIQNLRKALQEATAALVIAEKRRDVLEKALEKSVELQSHYAWLLNTYDGGKRMQFKTAQSWIDRLNKLAQEGADNA